MSDTDLVPDKVIVLFAPHHSTQRLPLDIAKIVSHRERADAPVEFIGLRPSLLNDIIKELFVKVALVLLGQTKSYDRTLAGWHSVAFVESIPRGTLGPSTMWIDCANLPINDMTVKCVLNNYRQNPSQLFASNGNTERRQGIERASMLHFAIVLQGHIFAHHVLRTERSMRTKRRTRLLVLAAIEGFEIGVILGEKHLR